MLRDGKTKQTQRVLLSKHLAIVSLMSVFLSAATVQAAPTCDSIFVETSTVSQNETSGAKFLIEKDQRLHMSPAIQKNAAREKSLNGSVLQKPVDRVTAWLNHLGSVAAKAQNSPSAVKMIQEIFHKQFVIKPQDVPASYFQNQTRLARERGHGDTFLSEGQKKQLTDILITDQKKSLDTWVSYLLSKDTQMYPMWAKYWMFNGMVKLSKFNPQNESFGTRGKDTVAPFPDLNREALSYVMDMIVQKVNGKDLNSIQDPAMQNLLTSAQFGKMYARALTKAGVGKNGRFQSNEGKWIVYPKGSNPIPLVKSLEGRNTGWCTAGESTARLQIAKGDFHVYYSLDQNGEATIPRVAIRMENEKIMEVRGVSQDQNLDPQISNTAVVTNKLGEFAQEGVAYLKKDRQMRQLTEIDKRFKLSRELTKEDLKFLYEIDEPIEGFGYSRDPRLNSILLNRDLKDDLVIIFDNKFKKDEISLTKEEALGGKSKLHYGDLYVEENLPQGFHLPEVILGKLDLDRVTSVDGVVMPKIVHGHLKMRWVKEAQYLKLPEVVHGELDLGALVSVKQLILPHTVDKTIYLDSLISPDGVVLPKEIKGGISLSSLTTIGNLKFPETMSGDLYLNSITSSAGMKLPRVIHGDLILENLQSSKDLVLPEAVYGRLAIVALTSAKGLKKPLGVTEMYGPLDFD